MQTAPLACCLDFQDLLKASPRVSRSDFSQTIFLTGVLSLKEYFLPRTGHENPISHDPTVRVSRRQHLHPQITFVQ